MPSWLGSYSLLAHVERVNHTKLGESLRMAPEADIESSPSLLLRLNELPVVDQRNSAVLTSWQSVRAGPISLATMELAAPGRLPDMATLPSIQDDDGPPNQAPVSDDSTRTILASGFDWSPRIFAFDDATTRETQSFELLPPLPNENQRVLDEVATDATVGTESESQGLEREGFLQLPPLLLQQVPGPRQLAVRFGWWNVGSDGAVTKTGEYQSLQSSPFWDVDGLFTNGWETLDFYATGLDNEATQTGFRHWKPGFSSRVEYQRFLRRLDHIPLDEFTDFDQQPPDPLPPAPNNFRIMKEDLNVGEDYAIRVQQLDTSFEGRLTDNVKWRLKIWGMRKSGERQANAMAHCFTASNATDSNGNPVTGISCHVVSQQQQIDWLTTEVEPALVGRFGPASVEYSRTMRFFSQDDQLVTRPYDNFGFMGDLPYAVVPDNYTEIDRLKVGANLPHRRNAYALLYAGNTLNRFRDTNRRFRGMDLRFTDGSVDGVSWTGYFTKYVQTGQDPGFLLPLETAAQHPIADRLRSHDGRLESAMATVPRRSFAMERPVVEWRVRVS